MNASDPFTKATAQEVQRELERFFAKKAAALDARAPSASMMLDAIAALTLRGGKRLRAVLAAAGYLAGRPGGDPADAASLGASMELLQSALLIHDDWMDGDETRRGGPAVHASLREALGDAHRGDSVGVLAGDWATSLALELFADAPFPAARREEAFRAFLTLLEEVYLGQFLDVTGDDDVGRMHRLKTTSYTVLGPLRLGALLGDAAPEIVAALERWAVPIGEAFQIRDDLLGTLGDPKATGKPGDDLRHGKRTALLREVRASGSRALAERCDRVVGRPDAPADEVLALIDALRREGVVARVEAEIDALVARARRVAESAPLDEATRARLGEMGERLGRRIA